MPQTITEQLSNGAVGAMATDTIYGLVCSAASRTAVTRLYELKDRHGKPGTVIAANIEQLVGLGLKKRYLTAVETYWPNPISVIVPSEPALAYLDQGKGTLAVRLPKDVWLQKLLLQTGPLLTSSANQPGQPPATTIKEAKDYFGDKLDFYEDGGNLAAHQASTVIRVVDDAVVVLRQGAIKIDEETGEILK